MIVSVCIYIEVKVWVVEYFGYVMYKVVEVCEGWE